MQLFKVFTYKLSRKRNYQHSVQCKEYISLLERTAPPFVFSWKDSSNLSPLCLQHILHYLSVCITAHRAGRDRLGESFQLKTMGGAVLSKSDMYSLVQCHGTGAAQSFFGLEPESNFRSAPTQKFFPKTVAVKKVFTKYIIFSGMSLGTFSFLIFTYRPLKGQCHENFFKAETQGCQTWSY